jgi:hypothetical protein
MKTRILISVALESRRTDGSYAIAIILRAHVRYSVDLSCVTGNLAHPTTETVAVV